MSQNPGTAMDGHDTIFPVGNIGEANTVRTVDQRHPKLILAVTACLVFDLLANLAPGAVISGLYAGDPWQHPAFGIALLAGFTSVMMFAMAGAYRAECLVDQNRSTVLRLVVVGCIWTATLAIALAFKKTDHLSLVWILCWLSSSSAMIVIGVRILHAAYGTTGTLSSLSKRYVVVKTTHAIDNGSSLNLPLPYVIAKAVSCDGVTEALSIVEAEISSGNSIVLSSSASELHDVMCGIHRFRLSGVDVFLDIHAAERARSGSVSQLASFPLVHIIRRPMTDIDVALKRFVDLFLGFLCVLLILPVLVIISALILIEDGRPILFRQPRRGFKDEVFEVWKFRTMRAQDSDLGGVHQASSDDQRVTRVGRHLRDSFLDELPQIFNVLQGKMSLVGPRPHALKMTVAGSPVAELVAEYASRHNIRPGMTGLAQVRGFRGPVHDVTHLKNRVESDIEYIERWSLPLDLWIITRTIKLMATKTIARKLGRTVSLPCP
jgi:lipopolysaccharide/colanic/teichoic acid biosynthesis glycosyltransferase